MSPVPALRNIRKSLKPGGRFAQIVWRKREDNPWVHDAELRVREIVPVVSHEETNEVHCGPGPFSMSGPDMVSAMMRAAGFAGIAFERYDADICIGRDLEEAVEFAMALGPAGEIIRLAGADGERLKPKVAEALSSGGFSDADVRGSSCSIAAQANATARIVHTSRNATSRSALLEKSHSNIGAPLSSELDGAVSRKV